MKSIQSPARAEKGDQVLAANLLAQGGDDLAKTLQKLSATLGREVKLQGNLAEKQRTLALALRDFRVIQTKSAALACPEGLGYAVTGSLHRHQRSRQSLKDALLERLLSVILLVGFFCFMALLGRSCEPEPDESPKVPAHLKP